MLQQSPTNAIQCDYSAYHFFTIAFYVYRSWSWSARVCVYSINSVRIGRLKILYTSQFICVLLAYPFIASNAIYAIYEISSGLEQDMDTEIAIQLVYNSLFSIQSSKYFGHRYERIFSPNRIDRMNKNSPLSLGL